MSSFFELTAKKMKADYDKQKRAEHESYRNDLLSRRNFFLKQIEEHTNPGRLMKSSLQSALKSIENDIAEFDNSNQYKDDWFVNFTLQDALKAIENEIAEFDNSNNEISS